METARSTPTAGFALALGPASLLLGVTGVTGEFGAQATGAVLYFISESAGQMSFLLELDDSLDVDTLELIDEGDWQDVVLEGRPNGAIVPASVTLDCNPNKRAKTDKECSHKGHAAAKTPHREQTSRKLKKKRPRSKQQIQELRMEIAKLEDQLSQLQRQKGFFSGASSQDWNAVKLEALLWRDAAAGLQKERLKAEASNTMLRKLLAAQVEFSTSLAKIAGVWEASAFDE